MNSQQRWHKGFFTALPMTKEMAYYMLLIANNSRRCKLPAIKIHLQLGGRLSFLLYFYQNFALNRAFGLPGIFNSRITAWSNNTGKQYLRMEKPARVSLGAKPLLMLILWHTYNAQSPARGDILVALGASPEKKSHKIHTAEL